METINQQKHFVLIHGACHGAWCWYKLETLLTSAGHTVTSLDLAASGINPKQVQDLNSIADYYEPLMDFMASLPQDEKVILVGHSYNGISISVAMEKFPEKISVAVFISAIMPTPAVSFSEIKEEHDRRQAKAGIQGTSSRYDRRQANTSSKYEISQVKGITQAIPTPEKRAEQYRKSPPEDLTLATKLVRPSRVFGNPDLLKETAVSVEKYGSVRRVFVLGDEVDGVKDSLKLTIAKNPPDEVKEIPGSDHMVMLSKPQELCTYLQEIALRYS